MVLTIKRRHWFVLGLWFRYSGRWPSRRSNLLPHHLLKREDLELMAMTIRPQRQLGIASIPFVHLQDPQSASATDWN